MENSSSRNRSLDLLRGLAVLLVLGRHMPHDIYGQSSWVFQMLQGWHHIGWAGVDLFFVLSGFLVSGLLFAEYRARGTVDPGRFLIRRGLRIYPAFYFLVIFTVVYVGHTLKPRQVLIEAFFLQSYFNGQGLWLHTWTLAIEEHFYFVLVFTLWLLSKNGGRDPFRLVPWLWAFAALACPIGRLFLPYDDLRTFTQSHLRADALLFGTALSYWHHFHREKTERVVRRWAWPIAALSAALLWPAFALEFRKEPFLTRFGLTGVYLAAGGTLMLFLTVVPEKISRVRWAGWLAFLGVRSYSIYLWHFPAAYWLVRPLAQAIDGPHAIGWAVAIYPVVATLAGLASYRLLEQPFMVWRDRRFPSTARAVGIRSEKNF